MPNSTIQYQNDVDPIFYGFGAAGSLHYGILMMQQGVSEMQHATTVEEYARADALLRHSVDYLRGASQMAELLCNSFPESEDFSEWSSIFNNAVGWVADVATYRGTLRDRVTTANIALKDFEAQSNVRWMALLSNRSFNK